MKKYHVTALGELLIDFTDSGLSGNGNPLLEANPGGAPCNVLAMLSKLGKRCAFIGKVGRDDFGKTLKRTLEDIGISTDGLVFDPMVNTTLAFVHTLKGGERDFTFYRNPGADMMLMVDDLNHEAITSCEVFHFGSLSLTDSPCREATQHAVSLARASGAILSFDPNLREPLWDSLDEAKLQIAWGLSQCDLLKISDNELEFMTGEKDLDQGVALLREQYPNIKMLNLTAGENGAICYYGTSRVAVPVFSVEDVLEKTGAGDTFCGCVLNYVLEHGLESLTEMQLQDMLTFANAAASQIIRRKGALKVMPSPAEIYQKMGEKNREMNLHLSLVERADESDDGRGISLRRLEEMSGVKQSQLSRIEKGLENLRLDILLRVLAPLGKTLAIVPFNKQPKRMKMCDVKLLAEAIDRLNRFDPDSLLSLEEIEVEFGLSELVSDDDDDITLE